MCHKLVFTELTEAKTSNSKIYSLDVTTWWPCRNTSGVNVPWNP